MEADVTYCMMTQNSLHDTKMCLDRVLPYVKRAVIIDGGSQDDTLIYLRNRQKQEPKLEVYLVPWPENFSQQRNEYLARVPDGEVVLVSDPDELFTVETCEALVDLVAYIKDLTNNTKGFQFRCTSVSLKGNDRVWESLDNYWKLLLFEKVPGTIYTGNPHEGLTTVGKIAPKRTEHGYEHIKQQNITW